MLIALTIFVNSLAEVASIGLIVPILGVIIEPEQSKSSVIITLLQKLASLFGLTTQPEALAFVGLVLVGVLVVLKSAMTLARTRWLAALSNGVAIDYRTRLFEAYLNARFAEIVKRERGAIFYDIEAGTAGIKHALLLGAELMRSAILIVAIFGLLFYLSWFTTLVIGAFSLLGMYLMRVVLESRSRQAGNRMYDVTRQRTALQFDVFDGARVVKAYALEPKTVDRIKNYHRKWLPLVVETNVLRVIPSVFFELAGAVLVIFLVGLVFTFPSLGLTVPKLVAFVIGLRRVLPEITTVSRNLTEFSTNLRKLETIDQVLNVMPREHSGTRVMEQEDRPQVIRLENVSFQYLGNTDNLVLYDVSMNFQRGQMTAIVGPTGAGKTTVAHLLVKFYEPNSGRVMVNNIDLQELDTSTWRRKIGYVGQDTFLFSATIGENIALWDETVTLEQVERAAYAAQLQEFLRPLPEGFDTKVGDRGMKLSGGQRQRIAIARAILHHPDVLIFDEASSALDNITERAIHNAILQLRESTIVILIAHRLSTVRDADQIVVMGDGHVVELGRYENLLQARGPFWKLYINEQPQ